MKNIVILISGVGSNMEAIVRTAAQEKWPAKIAAVISNRRRPLMMQTVQRWGNRFLSDNELSRGALLPIARFPRRFGRLERVFHAISPKWSEDMLQRRLNRHVAAFVGSYYSDSNARTSSMTGIDLQSFGYL